jgi:antitoxin (DNA-binding transcriptional repressor) of toxin-antitoxin stability system
MAAEAHAITEQGDERALAELVRRARERGQEILLTDADNRPMAAVVPIEILRELQATQDAADIAICEASKADPRPSMTHDEFMALLDAEDAAAE